MKIWALYRVREEYEKEERKKGDQGKSGYKRWLKKVFKNGGGKRFQFPLNKGQKKVKNSCHFFFQIYDAVWWSSKKMQHVKWKEWKSHKTYIKDVLRWCRNAIVEEGFWWWGKHTTVTIMCICDQRKTELWKPCYPNCQWTVVACEKKWIEVPSVKYLNFSFSFFLVFPPSPLFTLHSIPKNIFPFFQVKSQVKQEPSQVQVEMIWWTITRLKNGENKKIKRNLV